VNEIGDTEARISAAVEVFRHTLHDVPAARVDLRVDGEAVSGEYILVEALNFGAAGPNLNFVPHGDPSDGMLDVVLAEEADRHRLRERLDQYRDDPMAAPVLRMHRARRIELRCESSLLHVDDELQRAPDGLITLEITIEPGALTFLIPEDLPATAAPNLST
jgi:diacylglycerol kinase family enzyme